MITHVARCLFLPVVILALVPHGVHSFTAVTFSSSTAASFCGSKHPFFPTRQCPTPRSLVFATIESDTATSTTTATDPIRFVDASSFSSEQQQLSPTAWQCDDEANCVVVPACDDQVCRTSLDVRIHNVWYDLSGWRAAHPAGPHWIDWYDGRDATEVMDGFHSEKGRKMYQRLPKSGSEAVALLSQTAPPDSATQLAFRQLRTELEADGWWERDMVHETTQLGIWAGLVVAAAIAAHASTAIAFAAPLSCLLLSLSMTAAGWLGHDYIHGVDKFAFRFRNFAALAAGLAPTWWSDKHNKVRACLGWLVKTQPI